MRRLKRKLRDYLVRWGLHFLDWCIEDSHTNSERNHWISEKNKFNREFNKTKGR
jgi:hypothetical protein